MSERYAACSTSRKLMATIDWQKFSDVDSDLRFIAYRDLAKILDEVDFNDRDPVWVNVLARTFRQDCSGEVVYEAADCFAKFILHAAYLSNIDFLTEYAHMLTTLWTAPPSFNTPNPLDTADRIMIVLNTSIASSTQSQTKLSKYFISRFLAPIYIKASAALKARLEGNMSLNSLRARIDELLGACFHLRKTNEAKDLADFISSEAALTPLDEQLKTLATTSLCLAPMSTLNQHILKMGPRGLVKAGLTRFNEDVKDHPDYTYSEWRVFAQNIQNLGQAELKGELVIGLGPLLCQQSKYAESFQSIAKLYIMKLIDELRIFQAHKGEETCESSAALGADYESDMEYDDLPAENAVDYDLWHMYADEALATFRACVKDSSLTRYFGSMARDALELCPSGYSQELSQLLAALAENEQMPPPPTVTSEKAECIGDFMKGVDSMASAVRAISLTKGAKEEYPTDAQIQCLSLIIKSKEEFIKVLDVGGGIVIKEDLSLATRIKALTLLNEILSSHRNLIPKNLPAIIEASYYAIGDDVSHETYSKGLMLIDAILDRARDVDPRDPLKKIVNIMEAVCSHGEFRKLDEKGDLTTRDRLRLTKAALTSVKSWLS